MKTSPYFAFYPADFLVGTLYMSTEEIGAFLKLLCVQWEQGGISPEEEMLVSIAGVPMDKLRKVLRKFELHEDGLLKNPRMEAERLRVESFRDRQVENGRKGGRPRKPTEGTDTAAASGQNQSHAQAPKNPGLFFGLTQSEPKKSQSESETESEAETKPPIPPAPPRGEESERRGEGDGKLEETEVKAIASEAKAEELDPTHAQKTQDPPTPNLAQVSSGLTPSMASPSGTVFILKSAPQIKSPAHTQPQAQSQTHTHTAYASSTTWQPTREQLQISAWFSRKPTTVWSHQEQRTWRRLNIEEEDLEILHWFYTESGCRYLRQDLGTLLTHWRGEVDRARNFTPADTRATAASGLAHASAFARR